jgi:hypothetical protein
MGWFSKHNDHYDYTPSNTGCLYRETKTIAPDSRSQSRIAWLDEAPSPKAQRRGSTSVTRGLVPHEEHIQWTYECPRTAVCIITVPMAV